MVAGIGNVTDFELLDPPLPIEVIDRVPSSISLASGLLSNDHPYRMTKPDETGALPIFLIVSMIVIDCPGFAQVGPFMDTTRSGRLVGSGPGPGEDWQSFI